MSGEGSRQVPAAPSAQKSPDSEDTVDSKIVGAEPAGAPAATASAAAVAAAPAETKAAETTAKHEHEHEHEDEHEHDQSKPTEESGEQAAESTKKGNKSHKLAQDSTEEPVHKPASESGDVEMKDAAEADAATVPPVGKDDAAEQAQASAPANTTEPSANATSSKNKTPARRKSTAGADNAKGKKLNKKGSKATLLHLDAKPGQHFFIKLKGYPQWPCIICDEDMLPQALIKTRPVSAARSDGTYREDYADGGKRATDRTFPIMYLATNEFGWVSNKDLVELEPDKVEEQIVAKMRKDLQLAHQIAAEGHDLDYFKEVLQQFQEELIAKQQAAEAKAAARATPKKSSKQVKASADFDDADLNDVDNETASVRANDKKRKKAEDSETFQRAESVKKPKIKLTHNSTPKSANGTITKSGKSGGGEPKFNKAKKPAKAAETEEKAQSPKEPEMSPEDRFDRKKKEVLFLRHKLQKGLLTRDQQPKEDEMKVMSEYLVKLEQFADLETQIIRSTKINKVLRAMLKLESIPKEEEFHFKPRSQALLDNWTKLLSADDAPASVGPGDTNGVNGHSPDATVMAETEAGVNGVKKSQPEDLEATTILATYETRSEAQESEKKVSEETPEKEVTGSEGKPAAEEANKAPAVVDATV